MKPDKTPIAFFILATCLAFSASVFGQVLEARAWIEGMS